MRLAGNLLAGLAVMLGTGCYEYRAARRPRLLCITLRELLLATLAVAIICGWAIKQYRRVPGLARRR